MKRRNLNALTQLEPRAPGKNLRPVTNYLKCSSYFRCRRALAGPCSEADHRLPTYNLLWLLRQVRRVTELTRGVCPAMISQQKQAEQAFGSVKYAVPSFPENCSMELTSSPKKGVVCNARFYWTTWPLCFKKIARSTAVKLALCLLSSVMPQIKSQT